MRVTSVIVRFLSLLDVAFVLVGALMVILMQAQVRAKHNPAVRQTLGGRDVVYVYAGWKGERAGKCYLMNQDGRIGKHPIRMDSADDIQQKAGGKKIVMLVFDRDGWDAAWSEEKIAELQKAWSGIEVARVYGLPISDPDAPSAKAGVQREERE